MTRSTQHRFARAGGLLSAAMLAASAANYALNLALARLLDPVEFGDASLMVTLLLGLTAIGVGLQLVTAQHVSAAAPTDAALILRHHVRRARRLGIAVAGGAALFAPALQRTFQTESALPFVILGVGIPVYLVQSAQRGLLQGRLEFGRLAASFAIEALVRLMGGLLLVWFGLGATGATTALSLSFVGSWLVHRPALPRSNDAGPALHVGGERGATQATALLMVGQIVINNGDVVLAKQVLEPALAGSYTAVALLGRAVFFCSWALASAAFPFALARDGRRILRLGVTAVAGLGAAATATMAITADKLAPIVFGPDLAAASRLFAPYALATSLFAVANFVATFDVGRGRLDSALVVLGGGILQTVLLLRSSHTPDGLVDAQLTAMALCLAATLGVHARGQLRSPVSEPAPRPAVGAFR